MWRIPGEGKMSQRWRWSAAAGLWALLLALSGDAGERLLVAVASEDREATSLVSDFAGRSRYYLLFSGTDFVQVLENPFLDRGPGAGPDVVEYLAQKGVGLLIAGRFGPLMTEALGRSGMKYFRFSGPAQEAVARAGGSIGSPRK